MYERPFVLFPLRDLHTNRAAADGSESIDSILSVIKSYVERHDVRANADKENKLGLSQVIPVGRGGDDIRGDGRDVKLWKWTQQETIIGILNITPDR